MLNGKPPAVSPDKHGSSFSKERIRLRLVSKPQPPREPKAPASVHSKIAGELPHGAASRDSDRKESVLVSRSRTAMNGRRTFKSDN